MRLSARKWGTGLGIFLLGGLASCIEPPSYPNEPIIAFESISLTNVKVSNLEDTIFVLISFTDGDGDLGHGDQNDELVTEGDTINNIFFYDSRAPDFPATYHMDSIPQQTNVPAVSGTVQVRLNPGPGNWACLNGENIDTMRFSIKIVDRAGNESNLVQTPQLIIDCQ